MSTMRGDMAPMRAWMIVFPFVFALFLLSSGLLLMLLDLSLVAALTIGLLLFAAFLLLVRTGYYVQVPSLWEIRSMGSEDEIDEMARVLCIGKRASSEETRSMMLRLVGAAEGKRRIWVAPRGLMRLLRKMRAVPDQEEALQRATQKRVVRRVVVTKRLKRVEE